MEDFMRINNLLDNILIYNSNLRTRIASGNRKYSWSEAVLNSPSDGLPYILNFSLPGFESHKMVSGLSIKGVYVSAGSACSKGVPSHVLQAMGLEAILVKSALRVSLSKFC